MTQRCVKDVYAFIHGTFYVFQVFLIFAVFFYFKSLRKMAHIHIIKQQIEMTVCCYAIRLINSIGLLIYYGGTKIIPMSQVSTASFFCGTLYGSIVAIDYDIARLRQPCETTEFR